MWSRLENLLSRTSFPVIPSLVVIPRVRNHVGQPHPLEVSRQDVHAFLCGFLVSRDGVVFECAYVLDNWDVVLVKDQWR